MRSILNDHNYVARDVGGKKESKFIGSDSRIALKRGTIHFRRMYGEIERRLSTGPSDQGGLACRGAGRQRVNARTSTAKGLHRTPVSVARTKDQETWI